MYRAGAGIKPSHFNLLADAGFGGAALLGYIWDNEDPVGAASETIKAFEAAPWFI